MKKPTKPAQFIHQESYSLKASKVRAKGKYSGKEQKTSVNGVCGEVDRLEGFHDHVENSKTPEVLYGCTGMQLFSNIEKSWKKQEEENKKEGKPSRRKDVSVMCSGVLSYPNKEIDDDFFEWQADCCNYLKEKYGDKLKTVIFHEDEENPHLHYLLCDLKTLSVIGLDPAKTEQKKLRDWQETWFKANGGYYESELKNGKKQKKKPPLPPDELGIKTQSDALKALQDDFYNNVGIKHGHERKIGARDRIHGPPAIVRAVLKEMRELQEQKDVVAIKANDLKDKAKRVLEIEKEARKAIDTLLEAIDLAKDDQALKEKLIKPLLNDDYILPILKKEAIRKGVSLRF
jgi:Plasmid recombination enzyme